MNMAPTGEQGSRPSRMKPRRDSRSRSASGWTAPNSRAGADIQTDFALWADMLPEQRGQTAPVGGDQQAGSLRFGQDVLKHQGIHIGQARLQDPWTRHSRIHFRGHWWHRCG